MRAAGPPLLADRAADLVPWVAAGVLGAAEIHASDVLLRGDSRAPMSVRIATACALWAPLHGHVCFDLGRAQDLVASSTIRGDQIAMEESVVASLPWPETEEWCAALACSPLVRIVDRHDDEPVLDQRPLVLHGANLYVQRQWIDECIVAAELRARAPLGVPELGPAGRDVLARLWPPTVDAADDAQRRAAEIATGSSLAVIVGGPGSGKTFTVTGILAALAARASASGADLVVGLAAPTGKAAQRMRDTIVSGVRRAAETGSIDAHLVGDLERAEPTTLHRLLGSLPGARTRFRHQRSNPLPYDVVVIDETSMVSLPMMARLMEALRPDARLVLIGDPDQLESVEAGAVLADIVAASVHAESPLSGRVARLGRSRRQGAQSPIGPLADAVREGRSDDALAVLRRDASADVMFVEVDDPTSGEAVAAVRAVVLPAVSVGRAAAGEGRLRPALDAISSVRILCAHRLGRFGAERWNELVESWLLDGVPGRRNFAGRALLATRNDLRTGLSNGDSGVMVTTSDGLAAAFRVGGEIRTFAPAQLDSVETAFATTVHKSQGSEYDTVVVVLPPPGSPLARRELLYTAFTRATRRLVVVGSASSLVASVTTRTPRASGLEEGLMARAGGLPRSSVREVGTEHLSTD